MRELIKQYSFKIILIVFMFIYISDDTVLFGTNANGMFITIKYIYIILITLLMLFVQFINDPVIERRTGGFLLILMVILMVSMLLNDDVRLGYFYKFVLLLYAFCITRRIGLKDFAVVFNAIMIILASISIIGFSLMYISPSVLEIVPRISNTANADFYNAILFISPPYFYSGFVRNYGIFREPGVYQMYLIFALLLQIHVIRDNNLIKIVVLAVAVITTMSTTGYIALAVVFIGLIFDNGSLSREKKMFMIVALVIGIGVLGSTTTIFSLSEATQYNSVFAKLFNTDRRTSIARFASITENIRIFFTKPIFGVGLRNLEAMFPQYTKISYGQASTHNTNTLLVQFAAHGFLYGFLWLSSLWKFSKRVNPSHALLVLLTIIILFVGENLSFSGLASLIIMYGVTEWDYANEEDMIFEMYES